MLADEPFPKALQIFVSSALVNCNLYKRLFSSLELPIKFEERFKVTSVPFSIPDFSLLSL